MERIVSRLEAVALKLESFEANLTTTTQPINSSHAPTNGTTTKSAPSTTAPPSTAFSSTVLSLLPPISTTLTNTSSADPSVHSAISLFSKAFSQQLDIIKVMESHPHTQPTSTQSQSLLAPLASTLADLSSMTSSSSSSSRSPCTNHLKFIAESSQCLAWIAYTGPGCGMSLPPQHIDEAWSAAEFWCNKVLLEHKSKDSGVQPWVAAIKEIVVVALKGFVAQYYPTGPVWGTHNISKSSTNGGGRAPPPPPPPPPPSGSLAAPKPNNTINNSTTSVGALLAEINAKGSGITAGLKKVTSDMKTKNIFKDGTGTCTGMGGLGSSNKPSTTAAAAAAAAAAVAACIGRMECEQGRKWVVENHTNNKDLQITETEPKQAIYIYNCTNCTIQVSGKVNSIAVDKCSNTALLFDTTVASCEVVNSSKVQIQWTGLCPTVAVDKTDGCQLYIPRQTVELCEVNTAKSSEVNVIILPDSSNNNNDGEEEEEEDAQESAIPEQFVSRYMGGKWTTEPVNHGSG